MSLVNLEEIRQEIAAQRPSFKQTKIVLAEFCVHFWSLFHDQDHLVSSNSIRQTKNNISRKLGKKKTASKQQHGEN